MDYDGMDDAMTNQANKQSGLLRRFGLAGAVIAAACLATGATFLGYGVDANLPWPVTANTTIAAKHCGGTVLAGTGSTGQFTLTLPAVTGFPSNCSVLIKNGDSTNGKSLSGFPSDLNSILWPRQSVGVKIVNGAWQTFNNPGQWVAPTGTQLFANASGVDTNDGLTTATPRTLIGACAMRSQLATFLASQVPINLADGTYTSVDGNGALCTQNGNGGNGPILTSLIGDCTTPANVILQVPNNDIGILVQDLAEVSVSCMTINGGSNSLGLSGGQLSVVDVSKVHFGAFGSGGTHVALQQQASYNILSPGEFIDGGAAIHWSMRSNAILSGSGGTTITTNVTFSVDFLDTRGPVSIDLSAWTLTNSSTVTGQRAILTGPGYIITPSNASVNSVLPGSSNASIALGFQTGAGDPLTTPIPAADLPAPTASALGGIESIAALAHNWIASIDTSGVSHQSQPATSDLSDVTAPTTWTATDGSGAGLTFATNADTRYVKSGKFCIVSFMIQWPTTSDTHTVQINGIPAACTAYSGTFNWVAGGTVSMEVGSVSSVLGRAAMQPGGTSLFMFGNGNQMTNANMSNGIVRGTITYITN
jgi:hypothetical protein